ncbi:MAG TPA: hypothetical protein VLD65_12390, partial [Anaerolineales bacterium]|nr:hypothetical protein [Anaerolineales bacterium]
ICAALALIVGVVVENQHEDTLIPALILLSVGLPFYVGYLLDRKQWGLLIPAWILTAITVIIFLSENSIPDFAGAFSLFAIALPFLAVYLANRLRIWALIVSGVLAYIGLFPLVGSNIPNEFSGPVVMCLLAMPFIIIYFAAKKAWWALIPVGVFSSIGVVALLDSMWPDNSYFIIGGLEFGGYSGVLLLGFAITFGILWLLRGTQPTAWAKYPAIGLLIVSILAFLKWQTTSNWIPAVVLLVSGVALILTSVLKRQETQPFTSQNS